MSRPPLKRRRGIYLLPAAFTVANIFCGFYSIVSSMSGRLELAALLIGWAILFDILDGRIARMASATSEFGREFDSLADVISFGVAPGVLAYSWGLRLLPPVGWLACFLFIICGSMRLARFNIQQNVADKRYFVGMPIPAAAGVPASIVFMFPEPLTSAAPTGPFLILILLLAFLMVSRLRYYSFKDFDLRHRQPYLTILLLALLFVAIATHPQVMCLGMAAAYMLSGPGLKLYSLARRRHLVPSPMSEDPITSSGAKELDG